RGGARHDLAQRAAVLARLDPNRRFAQAAAGLDGAVAAQHGARAQGIDGTERVHGGPARDRDPLLARPGTEGIGGGDTPRGRLEDQYVAPLQAAEMRGDGGSVEAGRRAETRQVLRLAGACEAREDRPPKPVLTGVQARPFLDPARTIETRLEGAACRRAGAGGPNRAGDAGPQADPAPA